MGGHEYGKYHCRVYHACIGLGLPIGILMSRSDRAQAIVTPILDVMQTIPSFVYLIPVVMLLGIGKVPGLISVVIYAIPPMIRLTNLGIRLVDKEVLEAADAFGASPWQKLVQVQPRSRSQYFCRCKPDNHDVARDGRHCLDDWSDRPRSAGPEGDFESISGDGSVERACDCCARDYFRPDQSELREAFTKLPWRSG